MSSINAIVLTYVLSAKYILSHIYTRRLNSLVARLTPHQEHVAPLVVPVHDDEPLQNMLSLMRYIVLMFSTPNQYIYQT